MIIRFTILLCFLIFYQQQLIAQALSGYHKEGFEGSTFPPTNWGIYNIKGVDAVWEKSNEDPAFGNASAFVDFESSTATDPGIDGEDWLITPQYSVASGDSLVFWFTPQVLGNFPDTFAVRVSTSSSNINSFTTEILRLINGVNYPDYWTRYAVSLNAFAGQNIYIAFRHTNQDGLGVFIDDVELGNRPNADVAIFRVYIADYFTTEAFNPEVEVVNNGDQAQTFDVNLNITSGYNQTQTVSLAAGEVRTLTFPLWQPVRGDYTVTATATLAGDQVITNNTRSHEIHVFEPLETFGWSSKTEHPNGHYGHGLASDAAAGKLFTFTGYNNNFNLQANTHSYQNNIWSSETAIPTARGQVSAQVVNGNVYIAGGFSSANPLVPSPVLSIYNIATGTWSSGPDMPIPVGDYAAAVVNDRIYYIGGYDGNTLYNIVQVYDPATNLWAFATPKPGDLIWGSRAAATGNTIVLAGGSNAADIIVAETYTGEIDLLDPLLINWQQRDDFPTGPVTRHAAGAVGSLPGIVYFTGGDSTTSGEFPLDGLWGYDVVNNFWRMGPYKPTSANNLHNFVPVIANDSIYLAVTGGFNGTRTLAVNEWLNLGSVSPLPVTMLHVSADNYPDSVVIKWSTGSETNNDFFTVERSATTSNFTTIGTTKGSNNSRDIRNYSFTDTDPLLGQSYYRIKQTDYDGSNSYSRIISVNRDTKHNTQLIIAPNPAQQIVYGSLILEKPDEVMFTISDLTGRNIYKKQSTYPAGKTNLEIPLQPGIYLLRISTSETSFTEKVVVK